MYDLHCPPYLLRIKGQCSNCEDTSVPWAFCNGLIGLDQDIRGSHIQFHQGITGPFQGTLSHVHSSQPLAQAQVVFVVFEAGGCYVLHSPRLRKRLVGPPEGPIARARQPLRAPH
jgi:hypothetical protein